MDQTASELRRRAAKAANAYRAGSLSWQAFMDEFGECRDEAVWSVVDLIEHEPKKGGWRGISEKEWDTYQSQLSAAIEALSK